MTTITAKENEDSLSKRDLQPWAQMQEILKNHTAIYTKVVETLGIDLMSPLVRPKTAISGKFKTIYSLNNDVAIALEKINIEDNSFKNYDGTASNYFSEKKRRKYLYTRLDEISIRYTDNCLVNYPIAYYFIENILDNEVLLISKLKYCHKGDLLSYMGKVPENWLVKLMMTYYILHENNIFHVDVKPENILICRCNKRDSLFVADIDDAIVLDSQSKEPYKGRVIGTLPYTPLFVFQKTNKNTMVYTGLNRTELEFADWYALAYIYSLNFLIKQKNKYLKARQSGNDIEWTASNQELFDAIDDTVAQPINKDFTPVDVNNFQDGEINHWRTDFLRRCLQVVNTTLAWIKDDRKINLPPKYPLYKNVIETMQILKEFIEELYQQKREKENSRTKNLKTTMEEKKLKF